MSLSRRSYPAIFIPMGKKRKQTHKKSSLLKKGLLGLVGMVILAVVLGAAYCWYLSGNIEARFSGRKWEIPSTVYSDTFVLFPGKRVDPMFLQERLERLGYRKTGGRPEKKGEFSVDGREMVIYLKDLNLPDHKRDGFLAGIFLDRNTIRDIRRIDTGESQALVELEPEIIMQYFGKNRELRRVVSLNDIPDHLGKAVIAIEDNRFYKHFGIDPRGIARAFYANIRHGGIRQGGSTLTQQLAKNYFLTPERTFRRKINEMFFALAMEYKYSKNEILEIYLNEIYFGQKGSVSINGAGEAADFYFNKNVKNLTLAECALLAGIIKAPNAYSPYANPEKCEQRRNLVLSAMFEEGYISAQELAAAVNEPIRTAGYKSYSRNAPYFLDYVSGQLHELYSESILSSQGFSIYTTLDTGVQKAAEDALAFGLNRLETQIPAVRRTDPKNKVQGAVLVMQPRTGNILAMVGGRDYGVSQFNRVTHARRQPGSCFKPIVTAVLLDRFKPSDLLSNRAKSYQINDNQWTPDNFGDIQGDELSVRDMLRLSCNRAAVDMAVRGGLKTVADRLKAFEFSTPFAPYPSIALGAFEVIPLELARAYCAFAADGILPFPLSVRDVVDEKGNVLVRRNMDIRPVLSPAEAFLITNMLESVVNAGTAQSLRRMGIDFPLAGKTGTTNNYRDAWFVGYTPDFLALVWIGFDNGDSLYTTGAGAAIPVFAKLVGNMPGYISQNEFTIPPGVIKKKICKVSGEPAVFLKCPETYEAYFLVENQPQTPCQLHGSAGPWQRFINGFKGLFK